jgi:hypothetical protein
MAVCPLVSLTDRKMPGWSSLELYDKSALYMIAADRSSLAV